MTMSTRNGRRRADLMLFADPLLFLLLLVKARLGTFRWFDLSNVRAALLAPRVRAVNTRALDFSFFRLDRAKCRESSRVESSRVESSRVESSRAREAAFAHIRLICSSFVAVYPSAALWCLCDCLPPAVCLLRPICRVNDWIGAHRTPLSSGQRRLTAAAAAASSS